MALELRQSLKLSQQLVITPALEQAIRLLQLNHQELLTEVQTELIENPTLEEIPGTTPDGAPEPLPVKENDGPKLSDESPDPNSDPGDKVDWERFLEGYSADTFKRGTGAGNYEDLPPIEATLASGTSLAEHLLWQFRMQVCTDEEERAGRVIIHNLDERGYLPLPLEELAQRNELEFDAAEGGLLIVQSLDPIGCGSRTLSECLEIQAKTVFPEDPFLPLIVRDHLRDIERRNYAGIGKALGLDVEDVVEYHKMLQKLEPWPGRPFSRGQDHYVTPDIYVFKLGDEWQVVLNEDGLPKLRVSPYYLQMLRQGEAAKKDERDYIKNKLEAADFLIKSIYRRQKTIVQVMECILSRQRDFFDLGAEALRPMILRDVADEIGVSESTVSRVTTNKYVQCPAGLFELKYFFNSRISRANAEDVASEAVRNKIRQIIADENTRKPLSDQAIANLLAEEDFKVARRTVAKYREAMGILPSPQRKKMF